tara:strand:- start:97 stop:486 length:390 start_codon:yes stop_codon:yes gene_type:complete
MDKIKIYTNTNCPYCKEVKKQLNENEIKFENVDTSENAWEWKRASELTGIPQVPTLYYKGKYLCPARDFANPNHLIQILNNFDNYNLSELEFISERIKTLNYNMSIAFGRMDQLLRQIENKLNIDEQKK